MAQLEARFDDPRAGPRLLWRYDLPADREVSIGRNPLTLADVLPENRAEWVTDPRDTFVSGCHAFVRWDGTKLHVRIRTHPKKPANPVLYKKEPADGFAMAPGEAFTIGNTVFALHSGDTSDDAGTDEDVSDPRMTRFKLEPDALKQMVFHDPSHVFKALSRFPELVRYSRDDTARDESLLKLVPDSLRQADAAALVVAEDRAREFRVAVRRVLEKPQRAAREFRPSNKLSRKALRDLEITLHVRGQPFDARAADVTFDAGVDWAICAPLVKDGPNWLGLYVAGHLPPGGSAGGGPPRELEDYQKVVGLAAQIYASAYELRRAEQQLTRYQGFLSRSLVTLLNTADPNELLRPKETEVTVLFCDLRESCRLAEQGAQDLVKNWTQISQALDLMTTAITDEGGVIGNLAGDAAMGFWGWPFAQPDQVARAVRAALRIQRDFARRQPSWEQAYRCGIGLAHGPAVAGRLGTADQIKLDVFGPVVNLAARLEGLTKRFGVGVLVDERVAEALHAADPQGAQFQTRLLGRVCPAGMDVCGQVSEVAPGGTLKDEQLRVWESAVGAFMEGKFDRARERLERFDRMAGPDGADRPAEVLLKVMEDHGDRAPAGWDGVIRADTK